MIPHLLLLWCVGTTDLERARYLTCTQDQAFKIVDAGEAPEHDNCAAATDRWLDRKESVFVHDAEALWFVCEALK